MDEPVTVGQTVERCPACGSELPADALSCLACGSPVITAREPIAPDTPPPPAPIAEPPRWPPSSGAALADASTPLAPGEQRCQWCGQISPTGATECVHCHAAFPDPARDAAMLAEAQRRLMLMEQELDAKKRPRKFWHLR